MFSLLILQTLFAPQNNRKFAPQIRTGPFWLRIVTQTEKSNVTQIRQGRRRQVRTLITIYGHEKLNIPLACLNVDKTNKGSPNEPEWCNR